MSLSDIMTPSGPFLLGEAQSRLHIGIPFLLFTFLRMRFSFLHLDCLFVSVVLGTLAIGKNEKVSKK